jgi:hypothetical protein
MYICIYIYIFYSNYNIRRIINDEINENNENKTFSWVSYGEEKFTNRNTEMDQDLSLVSTERAGN